MQRVGVSLAVALTSLVQPAWAQVQSVSIERGRRVAPDATISIRNHAGSVRVHGWDRDSVVLRGTFPGVNSVIFGGDRRAMKMGVWDWDPKRDDLEAHFDVFVPRHANILVKTVSSSIAARDVSGSFVTVAGHVTIEGDAQRIEVEGVDGDVTLDVNAEWVRARSGGGALTVKGTIADLGASTVDGRLAVQTAGTLLGHFESISGDVTFRGPLDPDGFYQFDSHTGTVDLEVPTDSITFDLATVAGSMRGDLPGLDQAADSNQQIISPDASNHGRVVVRTFKGTIVVRSTPM
jgi:hypothetical protein